MQLRAAMILPLWVLLSACAREEMAPPARPDWIVNAQLVFLASDARTPAPRPAEKLRLWIPYVVGDLYGAPNVGELTPATLNADLSFAVDLNRSREQLTKSLIPTAFSQKWMAIEPVDARVARLSPFVLPAEGIAPVGMSEWLDADTGARLMLIYVDRPARIRGEIVHDGRSLRFDIEATESGYLWIAQPEGDGEYRATRRPARLVLAVMPNA